MVTLNKLRRKKLVGRVFGKLIVLSATDKKYIRQVIWLCQCECGNTVEVCTKNLTSGNTRSCGCLRKEKRPNRALPYGEASFRSIYRAYVSKAKKYGQEWGLSLEQVRELFSQKCFYCGNEATNLHRKKNHTYGVYVYNGLDRVDNTRGYTLDNVVSCCKVCNRAKEALSQEVFIKWIHQAHEHLVSKSY